MPNKRIGSVAMATWVILVLGLACSIALGLWVHATESQKAQAAFDDLAQRVERDVQQRFTVTTFGMKSLAASFVASREAGLSISRRQFRAFVKAREIDRDFPGLRGFGFINLVPRDAVDRFVAAQRADDAVGFDVKQIDELQHPERYIITYIEPVERNAAAVGLDVGSERHRREAIERAVAQARITITAPITLVQDEARAWGFLVYLPVYADAASAGLPELRRAALVGVVYAPVVARELLAGVVDGAHDQIEMQLFDGSGAPANAPASPVFDSRRIPAPGPDLASPRRFSATRTIQILDRPFTLQLRSAPGFDAAWTSNQPWFAALGGLLLTLLLARLAQQSASGQVRAEALAASMTRDLDRLATVARRTTDAVVITDAARSITWVNEGFERITGYTAEEAMGQLPDRFLQFEGTDADTVLRLRAALDAGQSFRGELLNRAKDGRLYWIALEIQPLRNHAGALHGFMAIQSDVTLRKHHERELARQSTRLEHIIEGTSVGTWEWNVETGETVFNARWAEMVGYTLEELAPTTITTWSSLAHPDDLARSSLALERHFKGETPAYECESRMRHKDGHWVWVLDRGKLFSRGAEGQPRWMAGTHTDISERKAAEAALRASEVFLDQTGRIAGVGGWEVDLLANEVRWSAETCRIHGLEPGYRPSLDDAVSFYVPGAREVIRQAVRTTIDTGEGFDVELPFVNAQGRAMWVRAVGALQHENGQAARLVGAIQDVTQRRALEDALRDRNELMVTILENLPCGLGVFDGDLRLVASNRQFRELLDFPDELFAAEHPEFADFAHHHALQGEFGTGDVDTLVGELIERARRPALPQQFVRRRPDGRSLETRVGPMPDGGFVTTYTDVTARRAAEDEARRSDLLLRGAIEAIDEAFVLYDPDDRLVLCNERYRELYADVAELIQPGVRFEELLRAGAARGSYVDARGRVDAWVAERLASHRAATGTLQQKLGSGRTLRIVERRLPDGHIVGFRIDITELVAATEAAQQASLAKSQFLATMSHEIRTPMNAILGMLALLRRTAMSPRQADYAAKTEGAARSLLGLLNDILDFSKVEADKMSLDPQPFSLEQLMDDLSVIYAASVGNKRLEVLFDIDGTVPRCLVGDALRLQQVLINLGGNAIKFTAEGEVVVSVRVTRRSAGQVRLAFAVRDTGMGIAPEHRERIFSGFTQAEASTTRRFGGTGLGVVISQRIVALMGGTLHLASELGKGSCFSFELELPVGDPAALPSELAPTDATPRHVLVVDDHPVAREVIRRTAASLGWSVEAVADGAAAIAAVHAAEAAGRRFDALFIDWVMPGMDGWQTVRALRGATRVPGQAALVMVTALDREELAHRAESEQALIDGFLVKPVTATMLAHALRPPPPARPPVRAGVRPLDGMRLLIVEDNANNQQVARELLEDEGAVVQLASHGAEAVEAVARLPQGFDLVLMDLQMPGMDGFEATRRIRALPRAAGLPIVAMTANALASDRDACLAAGMNDHVGKPFDVAQLVAVIRAQLGRGPVPVAGATGDWPGPAAAAATATAGVDLASALTRLGGRRKVLLRMLRRLVADLGALPAALRSAAQAGDIDSMCRSLHTFRGVAGTVGARSLAEALATAEAGVRAAGPGAVPQQLVAALAPALDALNTAAQRLPALVDALVREADAAPATGTPAPSTAEVRADLDRLVALLQDSDLSALEVVAALEARFGPAPPPWLRSIDDAVHQMAFDAALAQCRAALATLGTPA